METQQDFVDKILKTASRWPSTTVFGGYVRDVVLGGSSTDQLHDLDIHFQRFSNMRGFIDFLNIWCLVEEVAVPEPKSKYDEKGTRTFIMSSSGIKLKVDIVFPLPTSTMRNNVPIDIGHLDFDVNGAYLSQSDQIGVFNAITALPMLSITHLIERINNKQFSCVNSPFILATGKNDFERKKSEIGKAIKLVYRAEKMVKKGWVQDGLSVVSKVKPINPYWHVSCWAETKNKKLVCYPVDSDPALKQIRERVYGQTTCCLCHSEYKAGETILVPPCGHTAHIACCDTEENRNETDRIGTGIVGWFANQCNKLCMENHREALQCPTCSRPIFV